jgi:hypothetical protein
MCKWPTSAIRLTRGPRGADIGRQNRMFDGRGRGAGGASPAARRRRCGALTL